MATELRVLYYWGEKRRNLENMNSKQSHQGFELVMVQSVSFDDDRYASFNVFILLTPPHRMRQRVNFESGI